jgi:Aerotolerance regulator N-terminal
MSFLYPSFLAGLLALTVPVAIHLFNFRRTRRVFFTNVALLRTVQTETKSLRRLKHWLVLAARLGFLTCLVLAFAQPFLPRNGASGAGATRPGATSLYLDNSLSMQNEQSEKRYIDIATGKLDELLTLFRNATDLQLLTNDFTAAEQQSGTAEAIRDRVTSVRLSPAVRSLQSVYRRQRNLLAAQASAGRKSQLFWFSDFQKSTVGDLSKLRIDTTDRLFLVPLNARPTRNIYVDSVWLSTPFVRPMQNNSLNVRLVNGGQDAVKNLPVKLYLDNQQTSTATATLAANGAATVSLNLNVTGKGFHRGRVVFDDYPLTFDNQYFFVIEASPAVRVLHLDETPASPDYVGAVFGNDSLFALRHFSARNFDVGQLRATDLVVLDGLTQVAGSLRAELERFVGDGGSLLVIPPTQPDLASYGPFLAELGVNSLQTTDLPNDPTDALVPLADPDRRIPFFADVFQQSYQAEALSLPSAAPVWRWSAGERLLTTRDGNPFLSRSGSRRGASGSVYMLGSPLAMRFGNLAEHALFVPVMYKIAALSVRAQRTAYSFAENLVTVPVRTASEQTVYKLRRDKFEIIPTQRVVNNQLQISMPRPDQLGPGQQIEPGYYELLTGNGTAGSRSAERVLAFNYGAAESQMTFYSAADLRRAFANQPNVQVFDSVQDGDFVQVLEQQYAGQSLWTYFLIAVLVFAGIEIALVRLLKG